MNRAIALAVLLLAGSACALGGEINVRNATELRAALKRAKPGDTITLAKGKYGNSVYIQKLNGTKTKPIVITGPEKGEPAAFEGGNEAIHFVDCNYVTLRNVKVTGSKSNGINADDGGTFDTPSVGVVFENVTIENVGPTGNRDALKLSGLDRFTVRNCTFSGWGGSAIDMVGCHHGVIEKCQLIGKKGYTQATGIQAKGGCTIVRIRRCFFKNAGDRAINLGGSTGLQFFRPRLRDYEAMGILVEENHFIGSMAPIAYVTSIHCVVRRNNFVNPEKWIMRILQEQPTSKFKPCQQGIFESNLVVFDKRVRTFVNVGPNTLPKTFVFRRNAWFCSDGNRRPSLPAKETEGVYQVDPELKDAGTPKFKVTSKSLELPGIGIPTLVRPAPKGDVGIPRPGDIKKFSCDPLPKHMARDFKGLLMTQKRLEKILTTYLQVSKHEWTHGFSHTGLSDQTGYIIVGDRKMVRWMVRSGGLARLEFPDGRLLHLTRTRSSIIRDK